MPPRVTRSSARLAQASSTTDDSPPADQTATSAPTPAPHSTRKRKSAAVAAAEPSPSEPTGAAPSRKKAKLADPDLAPPHSLTPTQPSSNRRGKKPSATAMSNAGYDEGDHSRPSAANRRKQSPASSGDVSPENPSTSTSRRKSSRRKSGQGSSRQLSLQESAADTLPAGVNASSTSSRKTSRKSSSRKEADASSSKVERPQSRTKANADEEEDDEDNDEDDHADGAERADTDAPARRYQEEEDDDDPFSSGFMSRSGMSSGLSNTLRALSGMMSGTTSRLRGILENLRARDDPSVQMIALTELSELLLVSNEDNLAGHFSPDQYVKELVALMQPNDFGEENPEMMLLACRCIANLMEALPAATSSVVYGGAVPVLCQKLLEIHYIDLAEQALSVSLIE